MKTLRVLLWKDLRRAWRNPIGWLVFLTIPLVITGLIGAIFGPKSNSNGLGRIRFAVVDEDDSILSKFLRGGLNQGEGGQYLEPVFLERADALQQVQQEKLSAMLVIPAGFTHAYLSSTNVVTLELVKNPAQSIHPAVLEELLGVVVTGLDALKQNFGPDLPEWEAVLTGDGNYVRVAELIVRAGDKIEAARQVLTPLRVTYDRESKPAKTESPVNGGKNEKASSAPSFNVFGYLLPGMASMFLLFLGENASRDVRRELEHHTLQRFRTLHNRLYTFIGGKVLFCFVFLLLGSAVMLGGGGLIFHIAWRDPLAMILLTASYCAFASGLMMLVPALFGDHQSSQAMGNIIAMALGLIGGSTFPAEQLPAFLREHVTAFMPNHWYIEAVRTLTLPDYAGGWLASAAKLSLLGIVLMLLSAGLLQRNLK